LEKWAERFVLCLLVASLSQAAGSGDAAADEFHSPSISAMRVEWRAALDQLRQEINTKPAVASSFSFATQRRENFDRLHAALQPLEEHVVLPRSLPEAEPNWFGYPLTLREGGAAARRALQLHLLQNRIDSRLLLAGNMTRQPGFEGLDHRVDEDLSVSDRITDSALWVGCHPGLRPPMIDWIAECVTNWLKMR
jgi:hypothetical protein